MKASQRLRYREIRRVHELVGRVLETGPDPAAWRPMALDALKEIVGGQVGLTVDVRIDAHGVPQMVDPVDIGWHTDSVRRRYHEYLVSGEMTEDPGTIAWLELQSRARHVAATRHDLVPDGVWYDAPSVAEARKAGDVNDFVVSSMTLAPGTVQGFIIYRAWAEKPFEPRHRRLMKLFHLLLARAGKFAAADRDVAAGISLTPRVREALGLFLMPLSLKEIAARLGLSRHTVNDYQKILYERFEVNSRLELMHRCRHAGTGLRLPEGLV